MKLQSTLPLVAFGLMANACLLPGEADGTVGPQSHLPDKADARKRKSNFQDFAIGKGDRFGNGQYAPRGLGTDDRDLESILNVGEVESGLKGLANAFKDVALFTGPHSTFENRQLHGATIGTPRVFIQSGIHARERGGPDNVLYFVSDLLNARAKGIGIAYGNQNYTNDQVKTALSAGIAFLPLVNPDGVAYDQSSDSCWRKNRNTKSAQSANVHDKSIGVDLNRNFAVMWDYKHMFNQRADISLAASDDPSSEVFYGKGPLSEPETQNVVWALEQHDQLSWFLDLHSFAGDILYAWGDDDSQTTDPQQSFTNGAYDGKRGYVVDKEPPDSVYAEYMEQADLDAETGLSKRMSDAMARAGGVRYTPKPSVGLYPTAGTSTNHALGCYYGHKCGANRIHGLTVEFGEASGSASCSFYPDNHQYHESMRQVAVGLMELLLTAAGKDGEKKVFQGSCK